MDMEIPYTVHPRPDSGLANGKLGAHKKIIDKPVSFS